MKKRKKSLVGYLGNEWYQNFKFEGNKIKKDTGLQLELYRKPAAKAKENDKEVRITIQEL